MTSTKVGELEVGETIVVSDYRHVEVPGPDGKLRPVMRARFVSGAHRTTHSCRLLSIDLCLEPAIFNVRHVYDRLPMTARESDKR